MNPVIFSLLTLQLLVVSWLDIKHHKISNRWVLLNLVLSPILYFTLPESYTFHWEVLLFPVGFIVVGFLFFLMGIMGAGDSKYLAALFLLLPVELHMLFFEGLLTATMIVGSIMLSFTVYKKHRELRAFLLAQYWQGFKDIIKSRFSYAPVICLAWIYLGVRLWS